MDIEASAEQIERYLGRRKDDFEKCRQAVNNNEFEFVQNVGHQIRGNGSSFGFDILGEIGGELEDASKTRDLNSLQKAMARFQDFLVQNH